MMVHPGNKINHPLQNLATCERLGLPPLTSTWVKVAVMLGEGFDELAICDRMGWLYRSYERNRDRICERVGVSREELRGWCEDNVYALQEVLCAD